MKNRLKIVIKTVWLTTALLVLLHGLNLCTLSDLACYEAGNDSLFLMLLMSFPTSVLSGTIAAAFLDSVPTDFFAFWLIITAGGTLQWFVLMPWLLTEDRLIILDLRSEDKSTNANESAAQPSPAAVFENHCDAIQPAVKLEKKPAPRKAATQNKPIPPHDRHGRTPLERALARYS
jgi:hypothetical protein